MKKILWESMLNSDFNEKYWRAVTEKYATLDFRIKIFLAITTSGTVAGWGIWQDYPIILKVLSSSAALTSIIAPFLNLSKKMEAAASHAGTWADLRVRYKSLWETFSSKGETDFVAKENSRLIKIFAELEAKEPKLKIQQDKKLAKQCQQEVLRSKHLI